jgi:D-alanyl-D-alanine carboxypeptidase/D-alanyl-D-alanine-endopeptidase (penicillin-binding protein 4)
LPASPRNAAARLPAAFFVRPETPRRWSALLAALGLVLGMVAAAPAAAAPKPTLRQALETATRAARGAAYDLSVQVVELPTGQEVYGHNADRSRILASNTKLFTTAAALDAFGPGYFFDTPLLARGEVVSGVLQGDLAVLGSGDPNFSGRQHYGDSYAPFRAWARALAARGIREVTGDLVLVHGMYRDEVVHPDWPKDQLAAWYEAPVAALSFNDNCVLVRVWGNGHAGGPARVEVLPRIDHLAVNNRARTVSSGRGAGLGVLRAQGSDELVVTGGVRRGAQPAETWVTVRDPVAYFGAAMRAALAEEGISIRGASRPEVDLEGTDWELVDVWRSELLSTLEVVNKRSQNFYAEAVLKHLGARRCGRGTWEGGLSVVADFLARIGLPRGTYEMSDGSGMSRNNRFSARQVITLLRHMYTHPHGREYLLTLPHAGEADLSWERRLARDPYRGNVFAKTGTLNGVSTLSGYAKAVSGKVYAFSILCNRIRGLSQARGAQDRIVAALVDNG